MNTNKNDLRIALVQSTIVWENIAENLHNYSNLILSIAKPVDIVVLPEMFTTGFSMNPRKIAEKSSNSDALRTMQELAAKMEAVISGSLIIEEHGKYYNRFIWMPPNGEWQYYDKRHLFGMMGENKLFTAGEKQLVAEYKNWRLFPQICYDVRFPVWSRNTAHYDVLIYTANFPAARRDQWLTLLKARAIENQSYVIAVNRTGKDKNGILYSGDSVAIDPLGKLLYHAPENKETIGMVCLSKDTLNHYREQFPVLQDADNFILKTTPHSS